MGWFSLVRRLLSGSLRPVVPASYPNGRQCLPVYGYAANDRAGRWPEHGGIVASWQCAWVGAVRVVWSLHWSFAVFGDRALPREVGGTRDGLSEVTGAAGAPEQVAARIVSVPSGPGVTPRRTFLRS